MLFYSLALSSATSWFFWLSFWVVCSSFASAYFNFSTNFCFQSCYCMTKPFNCSASLAQVSDLEDKFLSSLSRASDFLLDASFCSLSSLTIFSCSSRCPISVSRFRINLVSEDDRLERTSLKQKSDLLQMFLKKSTADTSCSKPDRSMLRLFLMTSMIQSSLAFSRCWENQATLFLVSLAASSLLACCSEALNENYLAISWPNFRIFSSASTASLSIKSRMLSFALSEMMFLIFLLFTKLVSRTKLMRFSYFTSSTLPSSYFWACLNRQILLFLTRYSIKFLSSSLNRNPSSLLSLAIFSSSSPQAFYENSGLALFTSKMTPSWISTSVLKDLSKFLMSLGNLSALTSDTELSSMINKILMLAQMSKSLCTKKELEISNSSPRLSLNPEQSKNTILSMMILEGTRVSENLSWPIFRPSASSESKMVLSPWILMKSLRLARKDRMVVLPTPVSPITRTVLLNFLSTGMEAMPESISLFSLSRFSYFLSTPSFMFSLILIIMLHFRVFIIPRLSIPSSELRTQVKIIIQPFFVFFVQRFFRA